MSGKMSPAEIEMAEKYSKKWRVPIDEAKKKVKEFLEKKPGPGARIDRTKIAPGTENLFPEPLGPLSEKVMDVNQAALSSAFTRQRLMEMSKPPEEIKSLTEKVDDLEKTAHSIFDFVNTTVKEWKNELQDQRRKEEREELIRDLDEKVIAPLREKVDAIERAEGGNKTALKDLTATQVFETAQNITKDSREWLEQMGFNIEMPKALSKEQVEEMMREREEKWKKEHDVERESRVEVAQIENARAVIEKAIDRVMTPFDPLIKGLVEGVIERRTEQPPGGGPPAGSQPSTGTAPPIPTTGKKEWGHTPLTPVYSNAPPKKKEK